MTDPVPTPTPDPLPFPVADPIVYPRRDIVDSIEDGDIAEYSSQDGAGTGAFNPVQTSTYATHGDYALECQTTTAGAAEYSSMISTSGLDVYPRKGDAVEFDIEITDTLVDWIGFFYEWTDANNYCVLRVDESGQQINLVESVGGTVSGNSTAVTINTNTLYTGRIEWDDGSTFGGMDGDQTGYLLDSSGGVLASTPTVNNSLGSKSAGWSIQADDSVVSGYVDRAEIMNR